MEFPLCDAAGKGAHRIPVPHSVVPIHCAESLIFARVIYLLCMPGVREKVRERDGRQKWPVQCVVGRMLELLQQLHVQKGDISFDNDDCNAVAAHS